MPFAKVFTNILAVFSLTAPIVATFKFLLFVEKPKPETEINVEISDIEVQISEIEITPSKPIVPKAPAAPNSGGQKSESTGKSSQTQGTGGSIVNSHSPSAEDEAGKGIVDTQEQEDISGRDGNSSLKQEDPSSDDSQTQEPKNPSEALKDTEDNGTEESDQKVEEEQETREQTNTDISSTEEQQTSTQGEPNFASLIPKQEVINNLSEILESIK